MSSMPEAKRGPWTFLKWFDPRARKLGTIGFILNRISGLGLTVYLFLHLIVLSQLARGQAAYDGFIRLAKNPVFLMGEFLVVVAVFLHGFNGMRIGVTSFGIGTGKQKTIFLVIMGIVVLCSVFFAVKMFGGE